MIDKKTFVLAVAVSWILTLVTVLLISNFAPSLTQPFTQQFTESNSVKAITFNQQKQLNEFTELAGGVFYFSQNNFTWTPSNPNTNDILAFICSFEYKVNNQPQTNWHIDCSIHVNRFYRNLNVLQSYNAESEDWQTASFKIIPNTYDGVTQNWINPNQSKYPIKLSFYRYADNQTYIRNVNLMLLVVDG